MPATKIPSHHRGSLTLHRHGEAKAVGGRLTRHEAILAPRPHPPQATPSRFVLHCVTSDVAKGASQEVAARKLVRFPRWPHRTSGTKAEVNAPPEGDFAARDPRRAILCGRVA